MPEGTVKTAGEPRELRVTANGHELAVYEWQGEGPPLVFVHATGFHARCWDQVIARLPGRRCFAIDARGHGRSDKRSGSYDWVDMGKDVAGVLQELGIERALGVGHSMGGGLIAAAAARRPVLFTRLLLVDPAISARTANAHRTSGPPAVSFVAKRRNEWASPEEMFDRFKERHPYKLWQPAALWDYCRYGLLPNPSGDGYVLACPPEVEAAVYAGGGANDLVPVLRSLALPVRVIRARLREPQADAAAPVDMSASPTAPDLVTYLRNGEDFHYPDLSHFIPMQAPEVVAQHVQELLV